MAQIVRLYSFVFILTSFTKKFDDKKNGEPK